MNFIFSAWVSVSAKMKDMLLRRTSKMRFLNLVVDIFTTLRTNQSAKSATRCHSIQYDHSKRLRPPRKTRLTVKSYTSSGRMPSRLWATFRSEFAHLDYEQDARLGGEGLYLGSFKLDDILDATAKLLAQMTATIAVIQRSVEPTRHLTGFEIKNPLSNHDALIAVLTWWTKAFVTLTVCWLQRIFS